MRGGQGGGRFSQPRRGPARANGQDAHDVRQLGILVAVVLEVGGGVGVVGGAEVRHVEGGQLDLEAGGPAAGSRRP